MKDLIACCGLDCERCDARIATVKDDKELREKTAKLWSELNGVPITAEMINCMGCRTEGVKTPFCDSMCEIRNCVRKKAYQTCGDCAEVEDCQIAAMILANNEEALSNLREN